MSEELPFNLEIEQALLGALLVNNDTLEPARKWVSEDDFYEPVHGRIFNAIAYYVDKAEVADAIRLKEFFEFDDGLKDVGGAKYLVRLAASATTIINAGDYAKTVRDLSIRRDLIGIAYDVNNRALNMAIDDDPISLLREIEGALITVSDENKHTGGAELFSRNVSVTLQGIERACLNPSGLSGLTTGIKAMNDKFGGLHNTDLVILAGRPAMGKTAMAINITYLAARQYQSDENAGLDLTASNGAKVGFFSMEMNIDQLVARIISQNTGISSEAMRRGTLNDDQMREVVRASQEIEDLPIYIDDTPALSIIELRSRAKEMKSKHGVNLIVIDYLQLMTGTAKRSSENRVQEISEIARGLKAIAKELDVPVLALSQLSRAVEQRENKRPMLSDLRESGSIEQDADMVLFLYRGEYYKEKEQPANGTPEHDIWLAEMDDLYGKAECIISKQRHGPTGIVPLQFTARTTTFSDIANDGYMPYRR